MGACYEFVSLLISQSNVLIVIDATRCKFCAVVVNLILTPVKNHLQNGHPCPCPGDLAREVKFCVQHNTTINELWRCLPVVDLCLLLIIEVYECLIVRWDTSHWFFVLPSVSCHSSSTMSQRALQVTHRYIVTVSSDWHDTGTIMYIVYVVNICIHVRV